MESDHGVDGYTGWPKEKPLIDLAFATSIEGLDSTEELFSPRIRRSSSRCESICSVSSRGSASSADHLREKFLTARLARKKAERQATLRKLEADLMLADAIDEEELAEELFSSSLGEPEEIGIASKTSIGSLNRSYKDQDDPAQVMDRRKQKKSSEGNPGSDVSQHLELLTNAIVQQSLDSVKINVFQGEATDFARWLNDVKVRVECYTSCPKKLMNKMQESLSPEVQERVFPSIVDGTLDQYLQVKERMRELYGSPEVIVRSFLEQLKGSKRIFSQKDVPGLTEFETRLRKVSDAVNALVRLGQVNGVNPLLSAEQYASIVAKLPETWEDELIDRLETSPSLETITKFVEVKLKRKRSLYAQLVAEKSTEEKKALKSSSASSKVQPKGVFNTVKDDKDNESDKYVKPRTGDRRSECPCCKGRPHNLASCEWYLSLSPTQRFEKTTEAKVCWNCLHEGHRVYDCRAPKSCQLRDCNVDRKHHETLCQKYQVDNDEQIALAVATNSKEAFATITSIAPKIFYNVACVKVWANGSYVTCYAMLDPCANAIVMSKELAQAVELKTIPKQDHFHTVAASSSTVYEESIDRIFISGMGRTKQKFEVGPVQVMECENFKACNVPTAVDVKHYPHLSVAVPTQKVTYNRVMLLIGCTPRTQTFFDRLEAVKLPCP